MLDLFKNKLDKTFVRYVITFLAKYEINPNILTIIGLLSGVISAYFIYKGHFIISIIPIILSASCDICDGWLARATKRVSKFGKILDTISDKYVEGLFGLALAFILKDFLIPGYAWAIIAVFGSIIISLVSNIGDDYFGTECLNALLAEKGAAGFLKIHKGNKNKKYKHSLVLYIT